MEASYFYHTIASPASAVFKEKGSKFIGYGYPVTTEEEVKALLDSTRKKHHDASHVCYGFALGPDRSISKCSDDGEPSHTAGTPILNQLKSQDLTDILLIVVRYFGGIKLGAGGLITAYKTAAVQVLENATVVRNAVKKKIKIKFAYEHADGVMKILKQHQCTVITSDWQSYEIAAEVKMEYWKQVTEKINLLSGVLWGETII